MFVLGKGWTRRRDSEEEKRDESRHKEIWKLDRMKLYGQVKRVQGYRKQVRNSSV